jgi:DNA repair exonuclease SbcCD ATPase subunit
LKTKINRLESAVAEAIERSSNPIRATQPVKERFEAELDRVAREKLETEQAFLRAKTEWEQEKLKMTGEVIKLRRAAKIMGQPIPREDAPEVNPKVRALENQLQESLSRWNAERERLTGEVQRLENASRQWDTERRQLNDHAGQLQQAFVQAQAKLQSFEGALREDTQSQRKLEEVQRQRDAIELHFQETRNEWQAERQRLNSEIERIGQQLQRVSKQSEGVSSEVVDQLRKQYEQRLQEAIRQKTQLAQELQSASALLESERARLSSQIASPEHGNNGETNGSGTLDGETISAEVSRVEEKIHQIAALIDDPEVELSTVIRKNVEKAELDAYLKGILFSLGRSKGL